MEIYTVIKRIIGDIEPYGDSDIDDVRTNNLNTHVDITQKLIEDLIQVARYKNRSEYSIKRMGDLACNELLDIMEMINSEVESERVNENGK